MSFWENMRDLASQLMNSYIGKLEDSCHLDGLWYATFFWSSSTSGCLCKPDLVFSLGFRAACEWHCKPTPAYATLSWSSRFSWWGSILISSYSGISNPPWWPSAWSGAVPLISSIVAKLRPLSVASFVDLVNLKTLIHLNMHSPMTPGPLFVQWSENHWRITNRIENNFQKSAPLLRPPVM